MMGINLVGLSFTEILLGVLYVSLALLVIVIAYRKLLNYLGKGNPVKEEYLVLYTVEVDQENDEYTFYFTADNPKDFRLVVLNADMEEIGSLDEGTCTPGGNIVRLKRTELPVGAAYYCIQTDNQKTMKKF